MFKQDFCCKIWHPNKIVKHSSGSPIIEIRQPKSEQHSTANRVLQQIDLYILSPICEQKVDGLFRLVIQSYTVVR